MDTTVAGLGEPKLKGCGLCQFRREKGSMNFLAQMLGGGSHKSGNDAPAATSTPSGNISGGQIRYVRGCTAFCSVWVLILLSSHRILARLAGQQGICGACSSDNKVSFGFSLMRGKRASMEDFYHAQVCQRAPQSLTGV